MPIYERENSYITLLSEKSYPVRELSEALFISEPTVRRDINELISKELVTRKNGVVSIKTNSPDTRVPMFIRNLENKEAKDAIAKKAAMLIKEGDTVMLDASTTAYCLVQHLAKFKNIFVITSGAKTALALATLGIRTLCTGGEMALGSFSYIGHDAERTLSNYNADIAFMSCRGISEDGAVTDSSIAENSIRKLMMQKSVKTYLLCDKSKVGKVYLNTLCEKDEFDGIIWD
jgi:DeoR/GlpR family transcriptional regulator of sugar metabolism